jgi:hypothetical protein
MRGKVETKEERDACVMRVNARALLRSHSGDIKIQMDVEILKTKKLEIDNDIEFKKRWR